MRKSLILFVLLAAALPAMASDGDDLTSLSYISYLERYATVQPASSDETIEAVINMPLVAGDRVDTAREARMEVVLADGNLLWLDEFTTLSLDAVAYSRDAEAERTVGFLADGVIMFEVTENSLSSNPVRIDGRAATVYLDSVGLYRLQALPSGGIRVEVMSGLAEASTSAGGVLVRAQTAAEVGGGEVERTEPAVSFNDDFSQWVESRRRIAGDESTQYVDLRYSRQAAQLDNYGSWVYVDSINAWAWQPVVGASWQPYSAGRWYWTPTGYAWISYEPWGWLPYHYGSWYYDGGFGWVWSWGNYWGPAWVSWIWWPGYVGWCPYGYYNSWYGGYYHGYYPPYRPPHPGGGGGYAKQPPRRDVMPPPRTATSRVGGKPDAAGQAVGARPALDLTGTTRLAAVDRRAWRVVAEEDFTSPHLSRLAKPGDRVMPTSGDQVGVVMTGPLATRRPRSANQGSEIEQVFRRVEASSPNDVSPLLARDSSLSPENARRLGRTTTVAEISRRSTEAATAYRRNVSQSLSVSESASPRTLIAPRATSPNRYRPSSVYSAGSSSTSASSRSGRTIGGRTVVTPRTSGSRVRGSSPVIVPRTSTSSLGSASPSSRSPSSSVRAPSSRSSGSGRMVAPRSSSAGSSRSSGGSRSPSSSAGRSSGGSSSSGGSRSSGASSSRPSGGSSGGSKGGSARRR
jgi:hypothetical protein